MPRLDASPVTMSLAVPCLLLLCFLVFATYMSAQNGFTANDLTTGITPGSTGTCEYQSKTDAAHGQH